jgi:hypothetical protein
LRAERDEAQALVREMEEHLTDCNTMIERWIEAFDMVQDEDGKWCWKQAFVRGDEWLHKYVDLARRWNKIVSQYNARVAPRNVGRPMGASEAQQVQVRKLRQSGMSLRGIADETSLALHTIRTIVGKVNGTDRTTIKHLERIDPDRGRQVSWKARNLGSS